MLLAAVLALAAFAAVPPPLEVALAERLAAGTVVVLDAPAAPARIEMLPDGVAVASSWTRVGGRVLVVTELVRASGPQAALRLIPAEPVEGREAPLELRGAVTPLAVPLGEPVAGTAVALALPARTSLRALLLRGALDGALLVLDGKVLAPRDEPAGERRLTLVPAGPAATLVVVGPGSGHEISVRSASLHAGYPLPAPERFRLPAGAGGEYAFEVPERSGPAELSFEAFNLISGGQLRVELEGQTIYELDRPLVAAGWSDAVGVRLPESLLVHGRASLVTVHLRPPPGPGRDSLGTGLRRLRLDVPLPARGPFGRGRHGDGDHLGGIGLSWWAAEPGAHLLRFHAADLDRPAEIEVRAAGSLLTEIDPEGDSEEREVEVTIPAELVRPGEWQTLELRATAVPWGSDDWSVSDLRVVPVPVAPPPASGPGRPPLAGEGPTRSQAPVGAPGQTPRDAVSRPVAPAGLPGVAAEPVGDTLYFGVPVAEPVAGEPPPGRITSRDAGGAFLGPPPLDRPLPGASPDATSAPRPSARAASGPRGEGLPGSPSLVRGPRLVATAVAETEWPGRRGGPASVIAVATDPPGAAAFLSRSPSYRGTFLGLTPIEVAEPSAGLVYLRLSRPGYHDAVLPAWLEDGSRLEVRRPLLPWRGFDFARPADLSDRSAIDPAAGYAAPAAGDLDLDGRIDLVIGDQRGGLVWRRNESTEGVPRFGAAGPLRLDDGRPLAVGGYAAPALADWDGDGQLDLLVGEQGGSIRLYRRSPPSRGLCFEDRGLLVADGALLTVGNDAAPLVVDRNGDGRPDLVVGSGFGIAVLFLGIGGGELTQVGPLTVAAAPVQMVLDLTPVDLGDWTGDGLADLVLADMYGNVRIYPAPIAAGETPGGAAIHGPVWQGIGAPSRRFLPGDLGAVASHTAPSRARSGSGNGATRDMHPFDFAPPRPLTSRGGLELYVGTYPHGAAIDLDGDGYRDLLFGNAAGEIVWLRGGEPHEFDDLLPIDDGTPAP